jgi:hypothetical protein
MSVKYNYQPRITICLTVSGCPEIHDIQEWIRYSGHVIRMRFTVLFLITYLSCARKPILSMISL